MPERVKATWQEALAEGRRKTAVFRYLMEVCGARYSWWPDRAALPVRLSKVGGTFCRKHDVPLAWAEPQASPVRLTVAYSWDWYVHLAHKRFGRPVRTWAEDKGRWYVGETEARRQIEESVRPQRVGAAMTNMRRSAASAAMREQARRMHSEGMLVKEIAKALGCNRRQVNRYLREDGGG